MQNSRLLRTLLDPGLVAFVIGFSVVVVPFVIAIGGFFVVGGLLVKWLMIWGIMMFVFALAVSGIVCTLGL